MVVQVGLASGDVCAGLRKSIGAVDMSHLVGELTLSAGAFAGCAALRRVAWPVGMVGMGASCFEDSDLEAADLSLTRVKRIPEKAFRNCGHLSEVLFPPVLTDIGNGAFEHCRCLPLLDLSAARATRIGYSAFGDCMAL
jgi:hypothetical protein